jgi:NAD(P)H-dependent FMN reductase
MRILALSGSLRAASINSALLRAAARLAPPEMTVVVARLGDLPLFNPDLESQLPAVITQLQKDVRDADALLIASPEYAHGVTGTIKNALDWLVNSDCIVDKPVAVLNASPRAHLANESLREILKTMSATIVEQASVSIPLLSAKLDDTGMVTSADVSQTIVAALAALRTAIEATQRPGPVFPVG